MVFLDIIGDIVEIFSFISVVILALEIGVILLISFVMFILSIFSAIRCTLCKHLTDKCRDYFFNRNKPIQKNSMCPANHEK